MNNTEATTTRTRRTKRMTAEEARRTVAALSDAEIDEALARNAELLAVVSRGSSIVAVDNAFTMRDALHAEREDRRAYPEAPLGAVDERETGWTGL